MSTRIHTNSKIFFSDPYVVRVDFESEAGYLGSIEHTNEFRKLKSKTYKLIQGTWGWSHPEYEIIEDGSLGKGHWSPSVGLLRSYFCFKDEIDALQFRLMLENKAKQVYMWPERKFTIHEVVESE